MTFPVVNMIDKGCKDTRYLTPQNVLIPVAKYFGGRIGLDPCTEPNNPTQAVAYLSEFGLETPWKDFPAAMEHGVFVNPPYGKTLKQWLMKIHHEAANKVPIIALLPGQRLEQLYWQRDAFNPALQMVCMVRKRIRFLKPTGEVCPSNPYGSILYGYNWPAQIPNQGEDFAESGWFTECFGHMGLCFAPIIFNSLTVV